ncbi:MAG: signal peptidase II [Arenicellales bacterium]
MSNSDSTAVNSSACDRAICTGGWLVLLVVIVDQLSKFLAEEFLVFHQPVAIIPYLNFTLAYNTGAAFSFLHQAGGWQNTFFIVVAILMSVVLLIFLYRTPRKDLQLAVALWLVLGGAIGNVIDRIRLQKVVDFIDFYIGQWHFATFNVADMAISIGAFLLILDALNLRLIKYRQK